MVRKQIECACLVPLTDFFGDQIRPEVIDAEGWDVSLDHLGRHAIPTAQAQAYGAKQRERSEQEQAAKQAAAEAEAERFAQVKQWVQNVFDEAFSQSRQLTYSQKVEDARQRAAGRIHGRVAVADRGAMTVVNDRGEPVIIDDYPFDHKVGIAV